MLDLAGTWTGAAGENQARALATDGTYIYVGLQASPAIIIKLNTSMTEVDRWTGPTNASFCFGLFYYGGYLYAAIGSDPALADGLYKIDVSDMSTAGSWNQGDGKRTRGVWGDGTYLYVGNNNAEVYKVTAAMAYVTKYSSGEAASSIYAVIGDGTYIYAGQQGLSPGKVNKILASTMAIDSTWTGAAGQNKVDGLEIVGSYVYAALDTIPGYVIKIAISTMTTDSVYTSDGDYVFALVEANGILYCAIEGPTLPAVEAINPTTLAFIEKWDAPAGAQNCITALGTDVYFGQTVSPAKVYKLATVAGWAHTINGVTPASIMGVAVANIASVNGIAA